MRCRPSRTPSAYRCGIIVARTFNVGQELANGKVLQHTITPRDGKPIGLGVIWERWLDRNEGSLLTFVMVTTAPNRLIATVTDRQPAIIPHEIGRYGSAKPTRRRPR